jgi:hypothetical protein
VTWLGPKLAMARVHHYKLHGDAIPEIQQFGVPPLLSVNPSSWTAVYTAQLMKNYRLDREFASNVGAEQRL